MTADEFDRRVLELEEWTRSECSKVESGPPISICPKRDDYVYAHVKALADVSRIMSAADYVELIINCDFFGADRPAPPNDYTREILREFEANWSSPST